MKSQWTPKYVLPEASNVIRALRPDLVDLFDRVRDRKVARAKALYDRVCAELDSIETPVACLDIEGVRELDSLQRGELP